MSLFTLIADDNVSRIIFLMLPVGFITLLITVIALSSVPKKPGFKRTAFFIALFMIALFGLSMLASLSGFINRSQTQNARLATTNSLVKNEITLEVGKTYSVYEFYETPTEVLSDTYFATEKSKNLYTYYSAGNNSDDDTDDASWYEISEDKKTIKILQKVDSGYIIVRTTNHGNINHTDVTVHFK